MVLPIDDDAPMPGELPLTRRERQLLQQACDDRVCYEWTKSLRPWLCYRGHTAGQLQFHRSPHITRALWPGNGFGKTTAMGVEVAWWVNHRHPYQKIPKWPVLSIWCAETYKQFDMLIDQLTQDCFGPERSTVHPSGWKYNKNDKCFIWPGGDRLFLVSGDSSWTHIQGINPDLMCFDEEPPRALYNEAKMRRRGRRKTRYCFAATATQGLTWMYHELYKPWLDYHASLGMDQRAAMRAQDHPDTWAWPAGGIADNPGADEEDKSYYGRQRFASEAERGVRLFGGFADFSGTPVFDLDGLERFRGLLSDGQTGSLAYDPASKFGPSHPRSYRFVPDGPGERGRVTIFDHPDLLMHRYVIGHDSAYGIEGKDFDYAVVLDRNTGRQVAEAQGRWGDVQWAETLRALHWYYGGAFLCGERQVGLITMRRLYDEMGVTYQFYNRDEFTRAKRRSDTLGHHRKTGDLVIRNLRLAVGQRDVRNKLVPATCEIVSHELMRQMTKYQFRPRTETMALEDATDADLTTGAPTGDHDDGVMALAYAVKALGEVERFEPDEPKFAPGTYGAAFGMETLFKVKPEEPVQHQNPFSRED